MEKQQSQYALITIGAINLLIPQHDISVIETLDTLEINTISTNEAIGQFQNNSGSWPVFSMFADFSKRSKILESDRYCVCLQDSGRGQFGIICTSVSSFQVSDDALNQTAIPQMMLLPMNPIIKLTYFQNKLYLMSNVEKLFHYLIEN